MEDSHMLILAFLMYSFVLFESYATVESFVQLLETITIVFPHLETIFTSANLTYRFKVKKNYCDYIFFKYFFF